MKQAKAWMAVVTAILGAAGGTTARGNVILDWNAVMLSAIRLDTTAPTLSTRNLAILNLAMYDAVNSVVRTHQPYAFGLQAPPGASAEAAAAAAGYGVLQALYPGIRSQADATFEAWRARVPDDASARDGLELGGEIARLMLANRAGDGASTEVPYIPSSEPGAWRRTPPFFRPPLTPGWRYVRPFAIQEVDPFVVPPPPPLDSAEYARDWEEVHRLGSSTSVERTEKETQIAHFWSDFSYTAMPPGHWQEIASTIASEAGTDLSGTARLMGLLSLAQADSAIVCWEGKYRYNLWRPVTAARRADEDGNPATVKDAAWDHELVAPPFPAYPSGHSTFSQAGAEVLTHFFGTDAITFSAKSDTLPGVVWTYDSLSACAAEVGRSRIYGGIHFGFDDREGKRSGGRVAFEVVGHWLLPVDQLPLVRVDGRHAGKARVRVHGALGTRVVVDVSNDLQNWTQATVVDGIPGGRRVEVELGGTGGVFFRAREE